TRADIGEEFARAHAIAPDIVAGRLDAEQEGVDGDEVHTNRATDHAVADIIVGLTANAHAGIEAFPVKTSRFIDGLWSCRNIKISSRSRSSTKRGDRHADKKCTQSHFRPQVQCRLTETVRASLRPQSLRKSHLQT